MSRLQRIEQALIAINDVVFQNLCDEVINYTEEEGPSVQKSGSQKGKQKSVKGTPDSYFQLPSGFYVLVEYTTQTEAIVKKIKDDIDKCLDSDKTGITADRVQKIIYCLNGSLSISQREDVARYCREKDVALDLRTLDDLASVLLGRCTHLAKEYLGIPVDSGQILTPKTFVGEYEASGYATKLSNNFLSRGEMLAELEALIIRNRVTIVSGAPGVGKTKVVLELFKKLSGSHEDATCYVISNKTASIFEDLRIHLVDNKPFFLLVDDANRQTANLQSLLSVLREKGKEGINVVITVRDYALEDIRSQCNEFSPAVYAVKKMSEDQITEILRSSDFKINNPTFIDRIQLLAEGNPRLAIMAAVIAVETDSLEMLHDVSELYEKYFTNSVPNQVFSDKKLLRVLGIVAYFYALNKQDKEFLEAICNNFELDYYFFLEALERLEQLELLQTSADFSAIRISEQVLGTYFFYKVFFTDNLLDFGVIMKYYFDRYRNRISDTVIAANKVFGYENVLGKTDKYLTEYWASIKDNEDRCFKFLDLFWHFKRDEAIAFVYDYVNQLPEVQEPVYEVEEKNKCRSAYNFDRYLTLLNNFFSYPIVELGSAIELAFLYVSKKPVLYAELCKRLKETFVFSQEDEEHGFWRQSQLVNYLCNRKANGGPHREALYEVMPTLMKTHFQIATAGQKRNSISMYKYGITICTPVSEFREKVWQYVLQNHEPLSEQTELFLYNYLHNSIDRSKKIIQADLSFIKKLIKLHFRKSNFVHCYLVHDIVYWFLQAGIRDKAFTALRQEFTCKSYWVYTKLNPDLVKARYEHDQRLSFDEFRQLKEIEIRRNFVFTSIAAFKSFYKMFQKISAWGEVAHYQLNESLDVVIDENARRSTKIALKMLEVIISAGNPEGYTPWKALTTLGEDSKTYHHLYDLISGHSFPRKSDWLLRWFHFLSKKEISLGQVDKLISAVECVEGNVLIWPGQFELYQKVDPFLIHKIVTIATRRNKDGKAFIRLGRSFFEQYLPLLSDSLALVKEAYFDQYKLEQHFDHDFEDLFEIAKLDNNFLVEYLTFYSEKGVISDHDIERLAIIWQLDNAETHLFKAFDYILKKSSFYSKERCCNGFFSKAIGANQDRYINFLYDYLDANLNSVVVVETIFYCIRYRFPNKIEEALLQFLEKNSSLGFFKELTWPDGQFLRPGRTIFGDARAAEYERVLNIVNKIQHQSYRYAGHKEFLKSRINIWKKYAYEERKANFMRDRE